MSDTLPKRSRNGCWTCKRRRRKCDETHPICNTCRDNNLVCEGYEPRLRWDVGVASRGYLTGASLPTVEHAPPRQKGRQRDLLKHGGRDKTSHPSANSVPLPDGLHQDSVSPASASTRSNPSSTPDLALESLNLRGMQKENLYQEFLTSGVKLLIATDVNSSPIFPIGEMGQCSEILYDVCVACQAFLSYGANSLFYELYSQALSGFRAGINHPLMKTDAATLNAALLLCTIGMLQGTPWTIHIKGMERLVDERASMSPLADPDPFLIQAIEVMGVFDLRAMVVGRQTPSLNVWRRYRRGQLTRITQEPDAVEIVTGLPRSMIDMLAYEEGELTEEELWLWPGCVGTLLQCQLWEAYKFALMLHVRRFRRHGGSAVTQYSPEQFPRVTLPSDEILLLKALSAVDAVYNGARQPAAVDSLVLNAILFPLFHVALEVFTSSDKERQDIVEAWFKYSTQDDPFANAKQSWEVLQVIHAKYKEDGTILTPDEVARFKGIEVALL